MSPNGARVTALLLAILACAISTATAEPADVSFRTDYWSTDRESTDAKGLASIEGWVRKRASLDGVVDFRLEGWAKLEEGPKEQLSGDFVEAFARWRTSTLDLRAGRQTIAWGRADKINPTDVFGSRDYSRRLFDDSENRLGLSSVQMKAKGNGIDLSLLVVPEFRPTILPTGEERLFGVDLKQKVPERSAQFGARIDRTGKRVDWSVSAAYYNERTGLLVPSIGTPGVPPVQYFFPKSVMLGSDFATEISGFGVRGEMALTRADLGEFERFASSNTRVSAALGADRTFAPGFNINAQLLAVASDGERCSKGCDPAPIARLKEANDQRQLSWQPFVAGASLRARYDFLADTAFAEATTLAYDGGGAALQVRFGYKLNDEVSLRAGFDSYEGGRSDYFGSLKKNKGAFVELRRGF